MFMIVYNHWKRLHSAFHVFSH